MRLSCKVLVEYVVQARYCLDEDFLACTHRDKGLLSAPGAIGFLLALVSSGFTEWHPVFPFFIWLFTVTYVLRPDS